MGKSNRPKSLLKTVNNGHDYSLYSDKSSPSNQANHDSGTRSDGDSEGTSDFTLDASLPPIAAYFYDDALHKRQIRKARISQLKQLELEAKQKKQAHAGHEYQVTFPYGFERTDGVVRGLKLHWPQRVIKDGKKQWLHWSLRPLKLTTPDRQGKFSLLSRFAITPWFSLGCALTIAGTLITAMIAVSGGSALLLPFMLSTGFLFLVVMGNAKTVQQRVPEILHAMFAHKFFKRLFRHSPKEYSGLLQEYWIDMDDRITRARMDLSKLYEKLGRGEKLSWREQQEQRYAEQTLVKLVKRRRAGTLPPRDIAPYKRRMVLASLPFNLIGGFMIGVLAYNLSITSIVQLIAIITGTAAVFASPPGWIIGIAFFLAMITAPTMAGIFIYGTSCVAKVFKPLRKTKHFFSNLFKRTIDNPDGEGKVRTFTPLGIFLGITKITIMFVFVVAVMVGNLTQMVGSAYLLNGFLTGKVGLFFAYALPAMAMAIHGPFYIMQAAKSARGWFGNKLNYFRDPLKVIDKRIAHIEALCKSQSTGLGKGRTMIEKLKLERQQIISREAILASKNIHWILFIIPLPIKGKYWVKLKPWVRDILQFQITRTFSMVGKGFLSYWGAMSNGGISVPEEGGAVPDVFLIETRNNYDTIGGAFSGDTEKDRFTAQQSLLKTRDILANAGDTAGSYCREALATKHALVIPEMHKTAVSHPQYKKQTNGTKLVIGRNSLFKNKRNPSMASETQRGTALAPLLATSTPSATSRFRSARLA